MNSSGPCSSPVFGGRIEAAHVGRRGRRSPSRTALARSQPCTPYPLSVARAMDSQEWGRRPSMYPHSRRSARKRPHWMDGEALEAAGVRDSPPYSTRRRPPDAVERPRRRESHLSPTPAYDRVTAGEGFIRKSGRRGDCSGTPVLPLSPYLQ